MTRTIFIALAGIGLVAAGPALAQGRGGGHGNLGLGMGAGAGAAIRGGPEMVRIGTDARVDARANSQGRLHASDRALLRSNANSALHDTDLSVDTRSRARSRSRGPDHASARARARANERSVLRSRTIVRGPRRPHN